MISALTKNDLVSAVHNLNTLTRNDNLSWRTCQPSSTNLLSLITNSKSYCTEYEGRTLRITASFITGTKEQASYKLEILDQQGGKTLYEFPNVQGIADLYFTVEIGVANVENIIRSLAGKRD